MNHQRLLTIVLVGMLLSACAQFKAYRTEMPALSLEDPYPECVVDKSLQDEVMDESKQVRYKPPLCDDQKSTVSHAIQHRHYQAWDKPECAVEPIPQVEISSTSHQ